MKKKLHHLFHTPKEGQSLVEMAIAVPIHWFDNLAAVNLRPWWVIDPPEGKIPALTPQGRQRSRSSATFAPSPRPSASLRGTRRPAKPHRTFVDYVT